MDTSEVSKCEISRLPSELLAKIYLYCDIKSLCRLTETCKFYRDSLSSEFIWKKKLLQLTHAANFHLPLPEPPEGAAASAAPPSVASYHAAARRLWHITRGGSIPSALWRCFVCDRQACDADCVVSWKFTFVIDFGCKTSWTKYLDDQTDRMVLKTHPTLVACPRLPATLPWDTRRPQPIVPECLFCRENEFPPRDQNFDDLIDRRATSPKTVLENVLVVDDDDDDSGEDGDAGLLSGDPLSQAPPGGAAAGNENLELAPVDEIPELVDALEPAAPPSGQNAAPPSGQNAAPPSGENAAPPSGQNAAPPGGQSAHAAAPPGGHNSRAAAAPPGGHNSRAAAAPPGGHNSRAAAAPPGGHNSRAAAPPGGHNSRAAAPPGGHNSRAAAPPGGHNSRAAAALPGARLPRPLSDAPHQELDISDEHELPIRLVPEAVWESRRKSSLHSIQEEMEFLSRDRGDSYQFRLTPPVDQFGVTDAVAMEFFVRHLMVRVKRDLERIKVWNVPVVMCEPVMCSAETRRELLRILFEKLLVQRVCLVPKGAAIALYAGLPTCLVVDSGAFNTVVAPVIDYRLCAEHVQHKPVGGYHIAQYLGQCIQNKKLVEKVVVGSLDAKRVKTECFLPYSLAREERRDHAPKKIYVRSTRREPGSEHGTPSSGLYEVELRAELYLSCESMYRTLDPPSMIAGALAHVSPSLQRHLLGRIILTGGNSQLTGFSHRLLSDLRARFPEHAAIISVNNANSMSGRSDVVVGASYVRGLAEFRWITREDYIAYGAEGAPPAPPTPGDA